MKTTPLLTLSLIVAIAGFAGCATTHSVYPANSKQGRKTHGVAYNLPMTTVEVAVPVKLTLYKPGKYAKYAEPMLGLNVGLKAKKTYALDQPTIGTRAVPDPTQTYVVKIAGGPLEERELIIDLSEAGVLSGATSTTTDKTVPILVETLKAGAEIAGKFIKAAGSGLVPNDITVNDEKLSFTLAELNRNRRLLIDTTSLNSASRDEKNAVENSIKALEAITSSSEAQLLRKMINTDSIFLKPAELTQLKLLVGLISDTNVKNKFRSILSQKPVIVIVYRKIPAGSNLREVIEKQLNSIFTTTQPGGQNDFVKEILDEMGIDPNIKNSPTHIDQQATRILFDCLMSTDAQRLAKNIREIRGSLIKFLTNPSPAQGTEAVLRRYAELEAELLKPFVGTTKKLTWTATFDVTPPEDAPKDGKDFRLFKWSAKRGVLLDPEAGAIYTGNTPKLFTTPKLKPIDQPQIVYLILTSDPTEQAVDQIKARPPAKEGASVCARGFYYRVPATGRVEVYNATDIEDDSPKQRLARAEVVTPQYGKVLSLPRSTGSIAKSSYVFTLYPDTGGIKQITAAADALPEGTVAGVGEAIQTVQDAEEARKTASQTAAAEAAEKAAAEADAALKRTDEISALTADRDLLLLQQEIEELTVSQVPESGVAD